MRACLRQLLISDLRRREQSLRQSSGLEEDEEERLITAPVPRIKRIEMDAHELDATD